MKDMASKERNEHEGEELFAMRSVVTMTGIPADTIRVWERRYQVVEPFRTSANLRRYSAAQIARLSTLKKLVDSGHRIGDVVDLDEAEVDRLIHLSVPNAESTQSVDRYLELVSGYEYRASARYLNRLALMSPSLDFVLHFVVPTLREVGIRWERGEMNIAHEHLVSSQMRSLIGTLLLRVDSHRFAKTVVVATPSGHHHEFGALIGALICAIRGYDVVYLGANVPVSLICEVVKEREAQYLLLSLVHDLEAEGGESILRTLYAQGQGAEIWIGSPKSQALRQHIKDTPPPDLSNVKIRFFADYQRFDDVVLRAR